MNKRRILLVILGLLMGWGGTGMAQATGVTFQVSDNPGSWFECAASDSKTGVGCVHNALGEPSVGKSLSVIQRGESITFQSRAPHHQSTANTIHTVVSLIYPTPASTPPIGFTEMTFDTDLDVGKNLRQLFRMSLDCMSSFAISIPTCSRPSSWFLPIIISLLETYSP